jgi:hypothetical protein
MVMTVVTLLGLVTGAVGACIAQCQNTAIHKIIIVRWHSSSRRMRGLYHTMSESSDTYSQHKITIVWWYSSGRSRRCLNRTMSESSDT